MYIRYVNQICIRSVSGLDQAWVNRRISDMGSGDIVRIQSFAWCGMAASSRTEADWRLVFLDPCGTARYQSHDHTDREKKHYQDARSQPQRCVKRKKWPSRTSYHRIRWPEAKHLDAGCCHREGVAIGVPAGKHLCSDDIIASTIDGCQNADTTCNLPSRVVRC